MNGLTIAGVYYDFNDLENVFAAMAVVAERLEDVEGPHARVQAIAYECAAYNLRRIARRLDKMAVNIRNKGAKP